MRALWFVVAGCVVAALATCAVLNEPDAPPGPRAATTSSPAAPHTADLARSAKPRARTPEAADAAAPLPPVPDSAAAPARRTVRVVDSADGAPVVGATVTISPFDGSTPVAGTTGADGRFEFAGGPDAGVRVTAPGHRPGGGLVPPSGAPETSIRLDPTVVVSGRVELPDGSPALGARVELRGDADSTWDMTTTDESGRFALADAPKGRLFVVRATAPSGPPGTRTTGAPATSGIFRAGDPGEIVVRLLARSTLTVRVSTPDGAPAGVVRIVKSRARGNASITGRAYTWKAEEDPGTVRVVAASETSISAPVDVELAPGRDVVCDVPLTIPAERVRLRVCAPDGTPVPGAVIEFLGTRERRSVAGDGSLTPSGGTTGADGRFATTTAVPPGTWTVRVEADGRSAEAEVVTPGPEGVVTLDAPRLVEADADPSLGLAWWTPIGGPPREPQRLSSDRTESGRLRLRIPSARGVLEIGSVVSHAAVVFSREVSVAPGAVLDLGRIEAPRARRIEGTIVLAPDDRPASADVMYAITQGSSPSRTIDSRRVEAADGRFAFELPDLPGLRIHVWRHGLADDWIDVPRGDVRPMRLRIPLGGEIRVRAADRSGAPCRTIRFTPTCDAGSVGPFGVAPDGTASVRLRAGAWRIAWHDEEAFDTSGVVEATVTEGAVTEVTLGP